MSRAPLFISAATIFCASSYLALADERAAIATAAATAMENAVPHQPRQDYPQYRHYRGYDEAPSAMVVSSHPV
jgi:hypothetical protein